MGLGSVCNTFDAEMQMYVEISDHAQLVSYHIEHKAR